ncbi:hypothetical protein KKC59_04555 [bacterium]|nr:hypothetical protein [bacterium]
MKITTSLNKENILIFFFFFIPLFLTMAPNIGGDAYVFYKVAENLFHTGDILFNVKNHTYSDYGILWSIVMFPFYCIGFLLSKIIKNPYIIIPVVKLSNTLLIASLGVYFYNLLKHFDLKKNTRFYCACFLIFSSMIWNYNTAIFPEQLTSLFALIIFDYLFRYKQTNDKNLVLWAGLVLGLSIHIKFSAYIVLFVPFLIYLLLIMKKKKKIDYKALLYFIVPYIFFTLLNIYLNYYKFGVFRMAYNSPEFSWLLDGSYGQLFSFGKGFFFYNLPIIISLFYFRKLWPKFKIELLFIFSLCFIFIFCHSAVAFWHAGASWGPRYLMPILPFCFIPFAYFLEDVLKKNHIKRLVFILFLLYALIQFNSFTFNFTKWNSILEKENVSEYELYFMPRYSPLFGVNYLCFNYIKKLITHKNSVLTIERYYNKKIDFNKYNNDIKPSLSIYKLMTNNLEENTKDKKNLTENIAVKSAGLAIFVFGLLGMVLLFLRTKSFPNPS